MIKRLTTDDRRPTTLSKFILSLLLVVGCWSLVGATPVFAVDPTEYKLLAPLPNIETSPGSGKATASTFIPGLFKLIIGIATALAVLTIMFGGIKYMSSDAFGEKSEAKKYIENALWGLMLALGAWLILFTINPNLVKFDIKIPIQEIEEVIIPPSGIVPGSCANCVVLGDDVPHKRPPDGCQINPSGDCQVTGELKARLIRLHGLFPLYVNESYPPTIKHQSAQQNNGSSVDVAKTVDSKVHAFIAASAGVGLRAQFEVETEGRKADIIKASCGSTTSVPVPGESEGVRLCKTALDQDKGVKVLPPINGKPQIYGEHFSVYLQ